MELIRERKEYETASFWKEADDDILFFKYAPKLEMTIDSAREIVRSRLEYCHGASMYVLIDATNIKSATKEARDYMNSREGGLKGVLGGAFLSNNVVATLVINLFLKMSNLPIPARFFTNKEEAVKWLRKIKAEKLQPV
jgi:hypothetical protein